jgi:serine phosphatase RsbU (regulator of sigma subunit)
VHLFREFGELGRAYLENDWAASPVGPVEGWSPTLRGVVDLLMHTRFPVTLMWGPEFALLYNEAYIPLIGDKHPQALGRPSREVFSEAWHQIGPMLREVRETRQAIYVEDELVPLVRHGFLEECYFTFSYSPVRNAGAQVEGVMHIATETTQQVIARRRLWLLTQLNEALAEADAPEDVRRLALPILRSAERDLAYADIELHGAVDVSDMPEGHEAARFALPSPDGETRAELVLALSRHLAADQAYLAFVRLVVAALRQSLDRVRARLAERRTLDIQRGIAEAFQRSLLPIPSAGSRPDVAVRYRPAAEEAQIGGDWYDLFRLPDGSLAVVIGDVAGHDQRSAAAMAQVRNMTRGVAYTLQEASPDRVLHGLDRAILGSTHDVFATGLVAQVAGGDADVLTFTWSNAGHPPPVLVAPDGKASLLETEPELMLGFHEDTRRTSHRLDLEAGSTVVLYTDGLVERRGVPISAGLDWLVDTLRDRQDMTVEQVCDYLLDAASVSEDDVALLVLRT